VPGAWSRSALAAAATTSALFATLLFAVVSDPGPRLAASNSKVVASGAVLAVPPGGQRCEAGQFLPAEARSLRVYAGADSGTAGEPLLISIADPVSREVLERREVEGGYPLGTLDVPVDLRRELTDAEVCIENLGDASMVFAGNRTRLGAEVLPHVDRGEEGIRIDSLRRGEQSLWALAPTVAHRFAVFKPSVTEPWALWAVLALAVAASAAAVVVAARDPEHEPEGESR
jgi:hypothetical protein